MAHLDPTGAAGGQRAPWDAGRRRRLAVIVLVVGGLLASCALAWPWVRAHVIAPAALVVWLLLRVLVLSIHRGVFWAALVCAAAVVLALLLSRRRRPAAELRDHSPALPTHPIDGWAWLVEQSARGSDALPSIGWNGFVQLAVALRALEHRVAPDYRLHDALRSGRMPLPPAVRAFLFPEPAGARPLLRRWLASARAMLHRLTGRERADRLRDMSALLSFLEESLEMPSHDDDEHERAHR